MAPCSASTVPEELPASTSSSRTPLLDTLERRFRPQRGVQLVALLLLAACLLGIMDDWHNTALTRLGGAAANPSLWASQGRGTSGPLPLRTRSRRLLYTATAAELLPSGHDLLDAAGAGGAALPDQAVPALYFATPAPEYAAPDWAAASTAGVNAAAAAQALAGSVQQPPGGATSLAAVR